MGIDYCLRCVKCYEKLEEFSGEDDWSEDDYDQAWEDLYEKLDHSHWFSWGKVNVTRLLKWVDQHREHGEFVFTAE